MRVTPNGVYVGTNGHFQLSEGNESANAYLAARTIDEHWESTRALERECISRFMEAT